MGIEKMVRDAEANADADAKRKELIEAKNDIDSLIYSTEKNLTENKDKVENDVQAEVEKAIEEAKAVKESDDLDDLKAKSEALSKAAMKIGQAMYGKQGEEEKKDDDTVDADFKEKTEDESNEKPDDEK